MKSNAVRRWVPLAAFPLTLLPQRRIVSFRLPSIVLCTSFSVPTQPAIPLCCTGRRARTFKATINLDDPAAALQVVREQISREEHQKRKFGTHHVLLHINLALIHYQTRDYVLARQCAIYAHELVLQHLGADSSHVYFSATTAARCCAALRVAYEQFLNDPQFLVLNPLDKFEAPRDKTESSQHFVRMLAKEEKEFTAVAKRSLQRPDHFFMRGRADREKRRTDWEETPDSNDEHRSHGWSRGGQPNSGARRAGGHYAVRRRLVADSGGRPVPK